MNAIIEERKDTLTDIKRVFNLQTDNLFTVGQTSASERINKLKQLEKAILKYRPEIKQAMFDDYRKPAFEVDGPDIFPLISGIRHTRRNLRKWMAPQRVPTPLPLLGSTSWIQYESKGVCLIISPWNFPFNLSFIPLVSAIAAGNCAIIKPSELTPHSSAIIRKIVCELFEENEIAVIEGDAKEAKALLELPFNHIFFTGSPAVGKIVMTAAAKNLSSVTLELGGKTPTIIDESADIATAANRIAFAKFTNCGQICIAPDYILVHESKEKEFTEALRKSITDSYGHEPGGSDSYARQVNGNHLKRLKGYMEDAVNKGAIISHGGKLDEKTDFFEPTIVAGVSPDMKLMQEEIFGPILPIKTYSNFQEAIDFINAGERPLALYIYSKNKKNIQRVLTETRAGGTCINASTLHFLNHNLPFGGVNNSGIGKSHGWFGFQDFSNARGIYRQDFMGTMDLLKPPYTRFKEKIIDLTIKWL